MPSPFAAGSPTIGGHELGAADRAALLRLARETLTAWSGRRPLPALPDVAGARERRGAFVTLTERGALRGCIGHLGSDRPLAEVVREMTVAAAQDDPRFPPVGPDEAQGLRLDISVLTEPQALDPVNPEQIAVGRDGLIVRRGARSGVLLPQVAVEHGLDAAAFLSAACTKAGLAPAAWRERGVEVLVFQAEVFGEPA